MVAYIAAAVILFLLTLLLQPNANSLHPLYRDRLGKAFLFRKWLTRPSQPQNADLVEEWLPPLSQISGLYGPYHLINTALNVEASKTVNRRGRNADFFMFSPKFVGSKTTGYVKILLQNPLAFLPKDDSVALMRFAVEAIDDGAAQSRPRRVFLFISS
jgi:hypothetical protein